jgi:mRNA-degrading endonuclease toxin of MazEF toxin-antitoxin module
MVPGRDVPPASVEQNEGREPDRRLRPTIDLLGAETRVLVEQTTVVDPQRLGDSSGRLNATEIQAVDDALRLILGL